MNQHLGEHAVIVGSGIAGLLTARALADFFDKVTIIESDNITEATMLQPRSGAPQGYHAHSLIRLGNRIDNPEFDDRKAFFPLLEDLEPTLLKNGANRGDLLNDRRFYHMGWKPQFKSGIYAYLQSRACLEGSIRSLLKNYLNIVYLYQHQAIGLVSDIKQKKITGVHTTNIETKEEKNIYADLIVDASGTQTHFPNWLKSLDFKPPTVSEIDIEEEYVSQIFKLQKPYDAKMTYFAGSPPYRKSCIMIQLEKNGEAPDRYIISCSAHHSHKLLPTTEGILEFIKNLEDPVLYNILKDAKPLGQCYIYKIPKILRRHYENLNEVPKGLIVIGDAFCNVDPYYGQGMALASLEASVLHQLLIKSDTNDYLELLQTNYFKEASKVIDSSWTLNKTSEAIYYKNQSYIVRLIEWYKKQVFLLANTDKKTWITIASIVALTKKPSAIFHPAIAYKVFKKIIFKK